MHQHREHNGTDPHSNRQQDSRVEAVRTQCASDWNGWLGYLLCSAVSLVCLLSCDLFYSNLYLRTRYTLEYSRATLLLYNGGSSWSCSGSRRHSCTPKRRTVRGDRPLTDWRGGGQFNRGRWGVIGGLVHLLDVVLFVPSTIGTFVHFVFRFSSTHTNAHKLTTAVNILLREFLEVRIVT